MININPTCEEHKEIHLIMVLGRLIPSRLFRRIGIYFLMSVASFMTGPAYGVDQLRLTEVESLSSGQNVSQFDPQGLFNQPTAAENQVFQNVTRNAMPMTPEQILKLKAMLEATQRASAASSSTPPKPTLSTQMVSLAPGALPPVIRLQQGFVTSAVFVDETGADWPIDAYDLGNNKAFNIQWQESSNVLMIQAVSMYNYGNLAVKLRGLSTPVMLTLVPGQQVVDYRIDLRIQKRGPNAVPTVSEYLPNSANDVLLKILDGISPVNSRGLQVQGGEAQVWVVLDKMYVRTRLTILSPGWVGLMTSPDGMHAYEMEPSSFLLVSKYGKPVELKLEGL